MASTRRLFFAGLGSASRATLDEAQRLVDREYAEVGQGRIWYRPAGICIVGAEPVSSRVFWIFDVDKLAWTVVR